MNHAKGGSGMGVDMLGAWKQAPAFIRSRAGIADELAELAPDLSDQARALLIDMYSSDRLDGTRPDPVVLQAPVRITPLQGAQMNRLMKSAGATRSLEVGFAYGFSTVWMMEALLHRPEGVHVAIDPFEQTVWGGVGLAQVARLGADARLRWIPALSVLALTDLIREGARFDFVYIDGNHRFDDVLVDFYLADQLTVPGGMVSLDDMWMPSIRSVASFVTRNRCYELVPQPEKNLTVFRKLRDDDRDWKHFQPFQVHAGLEPDWRNRANRGIRKIREVFQAQP